MSRMDDLKSLAVLVFWAATVAAAIYIAVRIGH
jgi:hypothetical protein